MEYAIEEEGKIVFSPQVAHYLLRRGFPIINIKPDKNNRDKTIFIFKKDEALFDAIEDYRMGR